MTQLLFELVSPEKLVLSKEAIMVTVPGGEGDYGVLAGHAPMITTVKPGVIEVFNEQNSAAADRIFVAGGFAEVTNKSCTVLAEEAILVTELNRAQLEEQSRNLANTLLQAKSDSEHAALNTQLVVVKAKLAAIAI